MRRILISVFLFCSLIAFSQENDFQTWSSFTISKKIIKKTDVTLKTGLRLRENSSLYSKKFADIKLKRNLDKRVVLALGYRYAKNWNNSFDISTAHRVYTDINYKNKLIQRISYSVRNRLQSQSDVSGSQFTFRQKFSLEYNVRKSKLDPCIETEYFCRLADGINKIRSTISITYPIFKDIDFDLAYRIQNDLNVTNPETLFIFEGKISYNL